MKKYFIAATFLLIAAGCNSNQPATVLPTPTSATTTPVTANPAPQLMVYKNKSYNFEFSYPEDFSFVTATYGGLSDQIVQLAPDTNKYPGTNYEDSAVTVSTGFAKDASQCLISPNDSKPLTQTQTINGQVFYVGTTTGVGAGNIYSSTIYRALRQTLCVEISLTVHTGNIGNYPAGTVTEVDQTKPLADLQQILNTFQFTN